MVGYLVLIRQHTLCLRLLSCEELTSFLDRVALEEVRIGVDSRMIERIRVRKYNAETADLIHRLVRVLSQSLKLNISGCPVLIDDRVKVFRNLEPHPHIIRIAELGLSVKPWLTQAVALLVASPGKYVAYFPLTCCPIPSRVSRNNPMRSVLAS